jgi:hypothetical protein
MTFTRCRLGCSVRIRLTATILWQQPPGTHYQWILFYQGFFADFFNTPTENSTSVEVYAVGCTSNRGQVKLSLVYSFEFGNLTYYCDDTSDAYYAPGVSTDPGYSQITCHRPDHVDAVAHANMSHAGGPPWSRRDIWAMELWSGLYPFKEIDLQERFPSLPTTFDPPPTPPYPLPSPFQDNAASGYFWVTGSANSDLSAYGLGGNTAGYDYHAKFQDYLSFGGWPGTARLSPGPPAVLTAQHTYFAGTRVTTPGGPGIDVGTFLIKMFTNDTLHR